MKNILVILLTLMLGGCLPFTRSPFVHTVDPETEYRQLDQTTTARLRRFDEPLIEPPYDKTLELYRFVWVRTFHHPIVIRVVRLDDRLTLIGKQFAGAGDYDWEEIDLRVEKPLTLDQWKAFQHLLSRTAFWEMPSVEPAHVEPDGTILVMMDGASWTLEGLRDGRRHLVQRPFIMEYPEFQQACLYLLTLSEIPVRPEDIY